LPSIARDDGALAHLADDLELASAIRRAFDAAGAFDYVAAAREADRLSALLRSQSSSTEPVRRGRYALQLLRAASLAVEPEAGGPGAAEAPIAAPDAKETPYGAFLAVRLAENESAAWKLRREAILPAIAEDRRDALDTFFAPPADCHATAFSPPMEGP